MKHIAVYIVAGAVAVFIAASMAPYQFAPSSLFHIDQTIAGKNALPAGTVILEVPAYDGAGYYQIARTLPSVFTPSQWPILKNTPPTPYAYQRFLLPLLAWIVVLGQEAAIPWAFLGINILAIVALAYFLHRRYPTQILSIVALCLCPAAIVGLHFSLAEPLTLLLTTLFVWRFNQTEKIDTANLVLLSGLVLAREVMILFIGVLGLWLLYRKNWRSLALLLVPAAVFLTLHTLIYLMSDSIPFLWSTAKNTLPFEAMLTLITGGYGYTKFTATSIPLAVFFVLPGLYWCLAEIKARRINFAVFGSLCFLGLMTLMPDHIWSSITSIGRVITPVYPLVWISTQNRPGLLARSLQVSMLIIGGIAAVGLAGSVHPYHVV
jgi:hypothetical protein